MNAVIARKKPGSREDRIFDAAIFVLVALVMLITIYPLYIVVVASFSAPMDVISGKVWIWPSGFNLEGYKRIFANNDILIGYRNTLVYAGLPRYPQGRYHRRCLHLYQGGDARHSRNGIFRSAQEHFYAKALFAQH
ncbi:MAG: hypothetical protein PUD63_10750 [Clostridia bacterium]|nr:hypothetical protein [Clostridia bacterium]